MDKITRQREDHYINNIVSLYLNNQDMKAVELTELYLSSGKIQDTDLLESRIKAGLNQLIQMERSFKYSHDREG